MRRALVLLLVALAACGGGARDAPAPAGAPTVPGLETAEARSEELRDVVQAPGAVTAEGEPADVRDARAALADAEAKHRLAVQQVARLEALARGAVAPQKELEAARAEEASSAAAALHARQVLASFGGGAARAPLAADEVWVTAQVLQPDVGRVAAGAPARVAADAYPGQSLAAEVDAPAAYVDAATRAAPVRLRVKDAAHLLRPGMTAAVAIEVGAPRSAVVVPRAAVVHDGAQPVVFVAEAEARYAPVKVQLGVSRDGLVEVRGVAAGARVVTTGAASLLSATQLPAGGDEE